MEKLVTSDQNTIPGKQRHWAKTVFYVIKIIVENPQITWESCKNMTKQILG